MYAALTFPSMHLTHFPPTMSHAPQTVSTTASASRLLVPTPPTYPLTPPAPPHPQKQNNELDLWFLKWFTAGNVMVTQQLLNRVYIEYAILYRLTGNSSKAGRSRTAHAVKEAGLVLTHLDCIMVEISPLSPT